VREGAGQLVVKDSGEGLRGGRKEESASSSGEREAGEAEGSTLLPSRAAENQAQRMGPAGWEG
jgi:hypothetical protein